MIIHPVHRWVFVHLVTREQETVCGERLFLWDMPHTVPRCPFHLLKASSHLAFYGTSLVFLLVSPSYLGHSQQAQVGNLMPAVWLWASSLYSAVHIHFVPTEWRQMTDRIKSLFLATCWAGFVITPGPSASEISSWSSQQFVRPGIWGK